MASRDLNDLDPAMREKAVTFLERCQASGCPVLIYCTYRSNDEQAALYAQGRFPLLEVNRLRQYCGLAPLGWGEDVKVVTNAMPGESGHNRVDSDGCPASLAFDCCPLAAGKLAWDSPAWGTIGGIGVNLGLRWYGTPGSKFYERPHFELTLPSTTEASTTGA